MSLGPPSDAQNYEEDSLVIGAEMRTGGDDSYCQMTLTGPRNAWKPGFHLLPAFKFQDVPHDCVGGRGFPACDWVS